jgi:hypothetical protein
MPPKKGKGGAGGKKGPNNDEDPHSKPNGGRDKGRKGGKVVLRTSFQLPWWCRLMWAVAR